MNKILTIIKSLDEQITFEVERETLVYMNTRIGDVFLIIPAGRVSGSKVFSRGDLNPADALPITIMALDDKQIWIASHIYENGRAEFLASYDNAASAMPHLKPYQITKMLAEGMTAVIKANPEFPAGMPESDHPEFIERLPVTSALCMHYLMIDVAARKGMAQVTTPVRTSYLN